MSLKSDMVFVDSSSRSFAHVTGFTAASQAQRAAEFSLALQKPHRRRRT